MKILLLNYEFPPLGGGAGNATFFLLKQLKRYKDLSIDLITSSCDKEKIEKFSDNIKIYYLDIGKNKNNFHYQTIKNLLVYSFKAFFKAKELLKREEADFIHAFFGIPCGFLAMLLGKPYIVSLRGSDVPFYNSRFYWLDEIFFRKLSKLIWKKAVVVIANSEGLKKLAKKTSPRQEIKLIYNGIDNNFFKPNPKIKKNNIILFVGRLIKRKGLIYLIKAFAGMPYDYREKYQLWLVGEGNEKQKMLQLVNSLKISNRVKFLGLKTKKELLNIYNKSKILVLPSLNEGMSNVVLEAMACGLPVVVTDVGGSKELINGNGFIIRKKSIPDIQRALNSFERQKLLTYNYGKESRKMATNFNWQKITEKYLNIYKNI